MCLFILSANKDDFFHLQAFKNKIYDKLSASGQIKELDKAVADSEYGVPHLGTYVHVPVKVIL